MSHPIFSSTADDNYREYPPKRMKRFNTIYEAGKIIPLYSDPKDMKKKDEEKGRLKPKFEDKQKLPKGVHFFSSKIM